jgi:hypothetical protein
LSGVVPGIFALAVGGIVAAVPGAARDGLNPPAGLALATAVGVAAGALLLGELLVVAGQVLGWLAVSADLVQFALRTMTAVDRFLSLLEAVRLPRPVRGCAATPDKIRDGIRLSSVSLRYQAASRDVLHNVTLTIPAVCRTLLESEQCGKPWSEPPRPISSSDCHTVSKRSSVPRFQMA